MLPLPALAANPTNVKGAWADLMVDDTTAMRNYYKLAGEMESDEAVYTVLLAQKELEYISDVPYEEVGSAKRKTVRTRMPSIATTLRKLGVAAPTLMLEYGSPEDQTLVDSVLMNAGTMLTLAGRSLVMDVRREGERAIGYPVEMPMQTRQLLQELMKMVPEGVEERVRADAKQGKFASR